jgi:hypothetical protein
MEELLNWVITATCYVTKTGDTAWLAANRSTLNACAESVRARCNRDGLMAYDSSLCESGSEITTYDSLDESLGQARSNAYIAVKTWACLVGNGLEGSAPPHESTGVFAEMCDRIAAALFNSADSDGVLPAVLECDSPGYTSRIFPVIEALVYPHYWMQCLRERNVAEDAQAMLAASLSGPLVKALKAHTLALLNDPARPNLFADGGIRLSSTSNNSWMSKIVLFQHVCRTVLRLQESQPDFERLMAAADAAHRRWQTEGVSAYWACSDQFINGEAKGSRYYPRIVTAALCLEEARFPLANTATVPFASV